jgi:hypothetical protein
VQFAACQNAWYVATTRKRRNFELWDPARLCREVVFESCVTDISPPSKNLSEMSFALGTTDLGQDIAMSF